ncbi:E4 protein [Papillomaviridae sp. Seabass_c24797]|nr:E4 protein [Papillomaviridae sp. Seabass_c24797]
MSIMRSLRMYGIIPDRQILTRKGGITGKMVLNSTIIYFHRQRLLTLLTRLHNKLKVSMTNLQLLQPVLIQLQELIEEEKRLGEGGKGDQVDGIPWLIIRDQIQKRLLKLLKELLLQLSDQIKDLSDQVQVTQH